jgi:hypothetical protein
VSTRCGRRRLNLGCVKQTISTNCWAHAIFPPPPLNSLPPGSTRMCACNCLRCSARSTPHAPVWTQMFDIVDSRFPPEVPSNPGSLDALEEQGWKAFQEHIEMCGYGSMFKNRSGLFFVCPSVRTSSALPPGSALHLLDNHLPKRGNASCLNALS